jgi:CRP-like cAMP-binding protein
MSMVSPSLRLKVTKHLFSKAIVNNPIFDGNLELVDFIVLRLLTLLYLPEDLIIRQGEQGSSLYFLAKGECEVWVRDELKKDRFVHYIKKGSLFGVIE